MHDPVPARHVAQSVAAVPEVLEMTVVGTTGKVMVPSVAVPLIASTLGRRMCNTEPVLTLSTKARNYGYVGVALWCAYESRGLEICRDSRERARRVSFSSLRSSTGELVVLIRGLIGGMRDWWHGRRGPRIPGPRWFFG